MLFLYAPLVLAVALATAAAASSAHPAVGLEARQEWTTGWWGQEFLTHGCQAPIIFVFAKATLEPGNLVSLPRRSLLVMLLLSLLL